MVVLAIIAVVASIVLSSQNSFNKTLTLTNTTYDIALTILNAETYGISSRAAGIMTNAGYGVHFQKTSANSFTFFADTYPLPSTSSVCHPIDDPSAPNARPGNCIYDSSKGEGITDHVLGNGITISKFCSYAIGSWSCSDNGLTSLDIVFARPNASPFISANGAYSASFPITAACLTVSSPQGGSRFISVSSYGQITANAPSCP